jgi:hypothetical protein
MEQPNKPKVFIATLGKSLSLCTLLSVRTFAMFVATIFCPKKAVKRLRPNGFCLRAGGLQLQPDAV